MPVSPTYPGIYIEELPSADRTITGAPTSITVFVGYVHPFQGDCAKNKRWGQPIRVFTFDDYTHIFGGLYNNASVGRSEVGYAVKQFFLNGGSDAYVVGLQPFYNDLHPTSPAAREEITSGSKTLAGIPFTATQLTDDQNKVTVMISNVRTTTNTNDTADILITYGSVAPPESYRGVQLDSTADAFIAKRLASSNLVKVPAAAAAYPGSFVLSAASEFKDIDGMPSASFVVTGSQHQATTFHAADFEAVFQANTALDKLDILNLLVIPGVSEPGIWSEALAFCERKLAFFIMDAPPNVGADSTVGLPRTIEDFVNDPAMPIQPPNGALYFPYLKTPDPITNKIIPLPPSGSVAGVFARTDVDTGVWKAPAGLKTSIANTTGVVDEGRMTDMRQGPLNDAGVNVLRSFPGSGTVVWGARTISTRSSGFRQLRYVPVRRMALFIEQTLLRNLGWVVFEPNDEPLWSLIRINVGAFMLSLFRQAAFQGSSPSQAFRVRCDATTTTPQDIANGTVNILVGFAPLRPAEFVIIKIAQLAGQAQAQA